MGWGLTAADEKIILHGPAGYATRSTKRLYCERAGPRTVITLEHVELENSLALYLVVPRARGYAICHAISNIPLETTRHYFILG